MASVKRSLLLVCTVCLLVACESAPQQQAGAASANAPLKVYTVNYPLAWMAERIAGEHARISLPLPADVDPAFWRPSPEIILEYQQADLILLNGAGYASWTAFASLPADRLVNTSVDFSEQLIRVSGAVQHKHGPAGEHSHGDVAFTVWLDPELAALQARAILEALVHSRPQYEADFVREFELLLDDFRDIDAALAAAFDLVATKIVFSHPVYQYLVRKYGLDADVVTWEPDQVLSAEHLEALPTGDNEAGIKLLVWEAEPLQANRQLLATKGYTSVVFSPVANRPASGDYLQIMQTNIAGLQGVTE
jgi:zinc transport system substrate-binding protein